MATILAFSGNNGFISTGQDFANPLMNNLKIMLAYLVLAQISVFGFCYIKRSYKELVIVGVAVLFIPAGLEFYAEVNQLYIDEKFTVFCLYNGLAHIFYGALSYFPDQNGEPS
jgi:hypothetical protein